MESPAAVGVAAVSGGAVAGSANSLRRQARNVRSSGESRGADSRAARRTRSRAAWASVRHQGTARSRRIGDEHRPHAGGGGARDRAPRRRTLFRARVRGWRDVHRRRSVRARAAAARATPARKVAQYPPLVGPASRLETVDEPALLASALAVFAALELTGLASADFIRRRNGTFAFLEVNPRPWGSISAARRRRRRSLHAARRAAQRWTPAR